MKTSCKFIVSCFLFMCTFFTFPAFVKAYDYTYIWSNSYTASGDEIEFSFMGPSYVYYGDVNRYRIPFAVIYNGKAIYRGVADAPRKMTVENSVKRLCEKIQIDMDIKGAKEAKELCEKRKSMEETEVSEVIRTQLYPTFLVPEALMAQDKYFTFNIIIGTDSGDDDADHQHNILKVDLTPGAENVPLWVYEVLGTFDGGLG